MTKQIRLFLTLFSIAATQLSAQDIRLSGHNVVAADSVWQVAAGTTILFDANASVEVLGGLQFQGTAENPISIDAANGSGLGFLINGQSNSSISLNHVRFTNLLAPMVFDPYWYREEVSITNTDFLANGNGAIIRIATPLLNLDAPTKVSLAHLYFANNNGGVVIDGMGEQGWSLSMEDLAFEYNFGSTAYQTPLHLDFTGTATNYSISDLLFNQNDGFGLSVAGVDQEVVIGAVYANAADENVIQSKATNYRLPAVLATIEPLASSSSWRTGIAGHGHENTELSFEGTNISSNLVLLDSLGNVIEVTINESEEGTTWSYSENTPKYAQTADGTLIPLQEPTLKQQGTGGLLGTGLGDGESGLASIDFSGAVNDIYQTIVHPKMKPGFQESWEVGGMFGGTVYDGRDLKLVRFSTTDFLSILPNLGLYWPGGALGYTGGAFIQHNTHSHVSYRASVNLLNVNAGKIISFPYMATSTSGTNSTIDSRGNNRNISHKFSTAVQTVEFEAIRHFKSNQLREGKKAKWIPAWTAGFGALHYTPYAVNFVRNSTDDLPSALGITYWYLGEGRDIKTNLRRAGTAGQNNVDGMRRYGSFAGLASTGFMLTYKRENWQLTGQIKGVLTTTDYLDDFGRGTYYGGDYNAWLENLPEYTYNDPLSGDNLAVSPSWISRTGSLGGSRAQNYMPDGYWEVKLSLSKNIAANPIGGWIVPVNEYHDRIKAKHELFKGTLLESSTWEWGSWMGLSAYDGRDLKYNKALGFVPTPTNMEWTKGLYVQNNTHSKFSWTIELQTVNVSYEHSKGLFKLGNGMAIDSYNSALDSNISIDPYLSNFYTKTSNLSSSVYYHLLPYGYDEQSKWNIVPSIGFSAGVMQYTPRREVTGLEMGDAKFFQWAPKSTYYADLRDIGTEGQHILPNGRAYSKWAGLYGASFQLSKHTLKWIYKAEVRSTMTTTDYLDDFGHGAWYGGDYDRWNETLDVGYFNANLGQTVALTGEEIAPAPEAMNLFTPRAVNAWKDGYVQFLFGISRTF